MDVLVSDQRYVFTPPKRTKLWTWFVATWVRAYLRKAWGLENFDLHGLIACGHRSRRATGSSSPRTIAG